MRAACDGDSWPVRSCCSCYMHNSNTYIHTPNYPRGITLSPQIIFKIELRTIYFQDLGFESFLVDMPKECFPEFVQEFYANLTTDKFGNYVSTVQGKRITLNLPILNCMLRIESPSNLSIYTKKGPVFIDGFGPLD